MSDLIDRQALLKQIDIDSDGEPGYYGDTWKFIDTIKSMPPAALSTNLAEVGTDAISRQQAINALERAKQNIHHNIERAIGDAICEILDEVENGIKQLPPIHPVNNSEMPNGSDVISRQAAIDAFNTNIDELVVSGKENADAVERYLNRVIDEIKQLPPIQPEPHWIPVTERLPEKSGEYLVTVKWVTGESDVDVYEYDARHKTWNDGESAGGERAVAWCNLPEPYKGVTE